MKLVVFYLSGCINLSLVPTGKSASDSDMTKSFFDDFGSSGYSQMWKKLFSLQSFPRSKLFSVQVRLCSMERYFFMLDLLFNTQKDYKTV